MTPEAVKLATEVGGERSRDRPIGLSNPVLNNGPLAREGVDEASKQTSIRQPRSPLDHCRGQMDSVRS